MKRIEVESSNIKSIGYSEEERILQVEFNNLSVYNYKDVPKDVYDEMIVSESKGKYLYQYIKGVYEYEPND